MRTRIIGALLLLVLASVAIVAVKMLLPMILERQQTASSDAAKTKGKIRIAVDNWVGYFPLCSPEMKNAMRRSGYILSCENDNADYTKRMEELKKGDIDFAVATVDSYLLNGKEFSFPGTIIMVIDESMGGDAILVRKDKVGSLDEVRGRDDIRVAFTPGSPSHHLLKSAADHFNIPELLPQGSKRIETEGSEGARKKLLAGTADVAVLWEPDVAKALEVKGIKKILGSEDTERLIVDILLVNRDFSLNYPEVVKLLLSNYFLVLKTYRNDPQELKKHIQKETGVNTDKIKVMLNGVRWATFMENCEKWFGIAAPGSYSEEGLLDTIESTVEILVRAGDFKKTPIPDNNPYRLTNSSFLEELFSSGIPVFTAHGVANIKKDIINSLESKFVPLDEKGWFKLKEVGTLRVDPIIFQAGSTKLSMLAKQVVDSAVSRLKHYPNFRIIIRGHTGTRGDRQQNLRLSKARAEAVSRYMQVTYNIDSNRIRSEGVGGEKPLPGKAGESQRAYQYRLPRVEIILVREEI